MATQEMTDLRIELFKTFERFGIPERHAHSAAHRINAVDVEAVLTGLKENTPAPKLVEVKAPPAAVVPPTEKELWNFTKGRQNIADVIEDGGWVMVEFTSVRQGKGSETKTRLEGTCQWKGNPYVFVTTEDPEASSEAAEMLSYLVENLSIGDPKEFIGKKTWAQFVHKGRLGKKVARFLTIEDYQKEFPAVQQSIPQADAK